MTNRRLMRALSVRQPWAWAILHAGKDLENRTWRAHRRGPVLLHASSWAGRDPGAEDFIERVSGMSVPPDLPRGGIVGAFDLLGCAEPGEQASPWQFRDQYGLLLGRTVELPFRPVRGSLFFFLVELRRREERLLRSFFGREVAEAPPVRR